MPLIFHLVFFIIFKYPEDKERKWMVINVYKKEEKTNKIKKNYI